MDRDYHVGFSAPDSTTGHNSVFESVIVRKEVFVGALQTTIAVLRAAES